MSAPVAPPAPSARQTWWALLASAVAILPLRMLFTDIAWLYDAWIGMALAVGPAALLRTRYRPHAVHLLPGAALCVGWLTWHFAGGGYAGVVPDPTSWAAARELWTQVQQTVQVSVAPLASTEPVRFALTVALIVLAMVVDLLAVVLGVPALAGVPLLLVFTLSGAVPRRSVHWWLFLATAVAFLLLLNLQAGTETARWGRLVRRPGRGAGASAVLSISGRRIAVIALVTGLLLPLAIPVNNRNAISDALHNNASNGTGTGTGGGVGIAPLARLRGDLTSTTPRLLFDVQGQPGTTPYYLKQSVLDTYTDDTWVAGPTSDAGDDLDNQPGIAPSVPPGVATDSYTESITVRNYDGIVPVLQDPASLSGVPGGVWDPQLGALSKGAVPHGRTYTEQVRAPDPSVAQLNASPAVDDAAFARWLRLPAQPLAVSDQVTSLVSDIVSPYQRALAIYAFFSPSNGFSYSLQTTSGNSGDALVDFLNNRVGFCQQYAGAMAVMLRLAGVPARVVIGFTHRAPDGAGQFPVMTNDAHAWVEAYFAGVGWIPFDPTPLSGVDAARAGTTPWAPREVPLSGPTSAPASLDPNANKATASATPRASASSAPTAGASGTTGGGGAPGWILPAVLVTLVALALLFGPALLRVRRRRSRLGLVARYGRTDPLWDELADTAVDLGFSWSGARSPRQVAGWLGRTGFSDPGRASLDALARSVERSRYDRPTAVRERPEQQAAGWLLQVERELRDQRGPLARLQARLLPRSLARRR